MADGVGALIVGEVERLVRVSDLCRAIQRIVSVGRRGAARISVRAIFSDQLPLLIVGNSGRRQSK